MLIENGAQYQSAKKQLARFAQGLAWLAVVTANSPAQRERLKPVEDALRYGAGELRSAIHEYEALIQGGVTVIAVSSLLDLGRALGRIRVAAHLSLMELGAAAWQSAEQLSRFEAGMNANLRLGQAQQIMDALGVRMHIEITVPQPPDPQGLPTTEGDPAAGQ